VIDVKKPKLIPHRKLTSEHLTSVKIKVTPAQLQTSLFTSS
jgi:hypothetical protein